MARILLTGAAGFIGYNVYKRLYDNHDIVALDNLSDFSNYAIKMDRVRDLTGSDLQWDEAGKLVSDKHFFYKADIAHGDQLEILFSKYTFDVIIHLAAMTGVRQSITQPQQYERSNVTGFENLMACCHTHNVKQVIYASSSSVYGASKETPFQEDAVIDSMLNYYAETKRMNELAADKYSTLYNMQIVGLRFFTVYGPWTRPDMATYSFMKNITEGKAITLFNEGNMERDFTYVGDIVESIARIVEKMKEGAVAQPSHTIYNIGEGRPVNLKEYVRMLEHKMSRKAIIENAPMNEGEMLSTFADCTRLFDFIGFKPVTTVEQGLEQTVAWFKEYQRQA